MAASGPGRLAAAAAAAAAMTEVAPGGSHEREHSHITTMAFDGDCHSMAQRALELDSTAPLVEHDPAECEMCAEYQKDFYGFAKVALPRLAEAYLELSRKSVEAFENAKMRGRFLEDLQEENVRLKKELEAREAEVEELQAPPEKKKWLR